MAQEKEIKLILKIPLNEFLRRIARFGFKQIGMINQLDIYFDKKNWFLYENLAALRFRKVNSKDHSFSFKKLFYMPKRKNKYYVEEIEVQSPFTETEKFFEIFNRINILHDTFSYKGLADLKTFLRKSNYFASQNVKKKRLVFKNMGNEIAVDDVDRVGVIVELECEADDPIEVAKQFIKKSEWERTVEGTSYIWLKKVKGLDSHIKNMKRFSRQPDWNVWENEKLMYRKLNQNSKIKTQKHNSNLKN